MWVASYLGIPRLIIDFFLFSFSRLLKNLIFLSELEVASDDENEQDNEYKERKEKTKNIKKTTNEININEKESTPPVLPRATDSAPSVAITISEDKQSIN